MSEFIRKFKSKYLWGNLAAMAAVVVVLVLAVDLGLDAYTHHGESIAVPNLVRKSHADADAIAGQMGLELQVSDTGYVKRLPPGCILEQNPAAGTHVKSGHIVYVIINATHSPTITLPDIIDNSSLREAMAKLTAMGFKMGPPQFVAGEKDWVYGVLANGRHVAAGDRIPVDATVVVQAGNGMRGESDSVDYVDPEYEDPDAGGDIDEFEEVAAPPTEEQKSPETTTEEHNEP